MANKARERKINETIPDKKGYLDQGFTLHGSPFQKGKKNNNFQTKKITHYSHAEMLQAGKCKLPFFLRVSVGSLRKRTKDILINELKDTHEPVRKTYLTLRKC